MDIARELGPLSKAIYQSTRKGAFDLPGSLLPSNGARVDEIGCIETTQADYDSSSPERAAAHLSDDEPLPIIIHLNNNSTGKKLHGIHHIIICTGYHLTLPFLLDFHEDDTPPANASDTVLVTDGTQIHNLHKDIFYIPDPTLAFIGVPYYTATFTLFDFQAMALAAVFSGVARLPSRESMKEEYQDRVRQKGSGRGFHSLKDVEEFYVQDLLAWVNSDREARGLFPPLEGHTATWFRAKEEQRERIRLRFGKDF
jgi:ACS family pantothenate transporter-like MFS transporter